MFVNLQPWDDRKGKEHHVQSVIAKIRAITADIKEAEDALISLNDSLGIIRSACQRNFINYLNR